MPEPDGFFLHEHSHKLPPTGGEFLEFQLMGHGFLRRVGLESGGRWVRCPPRRLTTSLSGRSRAALPRWPIGLSVRRYTWWLSKVRIPSEKIASADIGQSDGITKVAGNHLPDHGVFGENQVGIGRD